MSSYRSDSHSSSSGTTSTEKFKAALKDLKASRTERKKQREQTKKRIEQQRSKQAATANVNNKHGDSDDSTIVVSTENQVDFVLSPKKPLAVQANAAKYTSKQSTPSSSSTTTMKSKRNNLRKNKPAARRAYSPAAPQHKQNRSTIKQGTTQQPVKSQQVKIPRTHKCAMTFDSELRSKLHYWIKKEFDAKRLQDQSGNYESSIMSDNTEHAERMRKIIVRNIETARMNIANLQEQLKVFKEAELLKLRN